MTKQNIILRAIELADCDLIYKYENDRNAWQDGVNTRFYSTYAIEQYVLSTQNEDITKCNQMRLMIDVNDANSPKTIGCVDLYDIDFINSKAGVGIYIDKEYRQNGYAKLTLSELEKYVLNVLNFHQLYAFISTENAISRHLFESCSYKQTAELKDWLKTGDKYTNVLVYQKNHLIPL